jgi:hypothetical protein
LEEGNASKEEIQVVFFFNLISEEKPSKLTAAAAATFQVWNPTFLQSPHTKRTFPLSKSPTSTHSCNSPNPLSKPYNFP